MVSPKPKLNTVHEHRSMPTKGPVMPRASSLQPNMSNVLADLKRATSAKFNSNNADSATSEKQARKAEMATLPWLSKENDDSKNMKSSPKVQSFPESIGQEFYDRENNPSHLVQVLQHNKDQSKKHSQIISGGTHEPTNLPITAQEDKFDEQEHLISEDNKPDVALQDVGKHIDQYLSSSHEDDHDVAIKYRENATVVHRPSMGPLEPVSPEYSPPQALPDFRESTQNNTTDTCSRNTSPSQTSNSRPHAISTGSGDVLPTARSEEPTSTTSRSRRERARNRRFIQPSPSPSAVAFSPKSAQTISTQQRSASDENPAEEPPSSPSIPTPIQTSRASSNSSARATARDRYARHKKLIHQRHQAST